MEKRSLTPEEIKIQELDKRLKAVSQNNAAYIEEYPNDPRHWDQIMKDEIESINNMELKESKIKALEDALIRLKNARELHSLNEKNEKKKELRSILKELLEET